MSRKPERQPSTESEVILTPENAFLKHEQPEAQFELKEVANELNEREKALAISAHDTAAKYVTSLLEAHRDIPKSLKLGLYSIMLLQSETAIAQSLVELTPEANLQEDNYFQGEKMEEETQKTIKSLLDQGATITLLHNNEMDEVEWKNIKKAVLVKDELQVIVIEREVRGDDLLAGEVLPGTSQEGWRQTVSRTALDIEHWREEVNASIYLKDQFDNGIHISRHLNVDGQSYQEMIRVYPNTHAGAIDDKLSTVNVDLTTAGLGLIEGAFGHKTNRVIDYVAAVPMYNVSSESLHHDEAVELLQPYEAAIGEGLQEATTLFGMKTDVIDYIDFMDGSQRNAHAGERQITFIDEMFKPTSNPEEIGGPDAASIEQVRDTTKHEVFHVIDHDLDLCNSSEIEAIFLSTPHDVLDAFSEEKFNLDPTIYGGHASDSATEFVASFLNSLDDLRWNEQVNNLNDQELAVYVQTLMATRAALTKNVNVSLKAPIFGLLQQRLDTIFDTVVPARESLPSSK